MPATFNAVKDPTADLDYAIDWTDWLGNDVIATSVWIVPSSLRQYNDFIDTTLKKTTVWLSGGSLETSTCTVTNVITTVGGRTEERSIRFTITQR